MEGPVCIEMTTDRVSVESDEDYVPELQRYQLQACKRGGTDDRLVKDEHIVLDDDERLAQRAPIIVIDVG